MRLFKHYGIRRVFLGRSLELKILFSDLPQEEEVHDVGVIVEFNKPIGWKTVDLEEFLEDPLGMGINILTKRAVMSKPLLWKSIGRKYRVVRWVLWRK